MGNVISAILIVLIILAIAFFPIYGWVNNIVQFCKCDFEAPYKAEVCRGIGVIIPPVGCVEGFLHINDGPPQEEK
jgi:hypothetical protein